MSLDMRDTCPRPRPVFRSRSRRRCPERSSGRRAGSCPTPPLAHTEIPWPLIAGMRHRLVHDYGRVDYAVVHRVIIEHLPVLVAQLKAIVASDGV